MPILDDEFEDYCTELAEDLPSHIEINDPSDQDYINDIDLLTRRGKILADYDIDD